MKSTRKKINIGIDCRCLSVEGGTKVYALGLIKNLLLIDQHNEYYLFYNNKKYLGSFRGQNIKEVAINFNFPALYFLWDQIIIPFLCYKYKVDVIHGLKSTVPLIVKAKKVVTVHDLIPVLFPQITKWHYVLYWRLIFFLMSKIKVDYIFVSRSTKNDFSLTYKTKNNLNVIYHGCDSARIKNYIHNDQEKDFILYVGSAEPRKNLPRLIQAFSLITNEFPDVELHLVGSLGRGSQSVDRAISNYNLEKAVRRLGYVPVLELKKIYHCARVLVLVSQYEGFGFPIIEAMRIGLPVVTSKGGSLPEIAGGAALLADHTDVKDIADKIRLILKNDNLRQELINKGFKNVKRFSWAKTVKQTLEIYEE